MPPPPCCCERDGWRAITVALQPLVTRTRYGSTSVHTQHQREKERERLTIVALSAVPAALRGRAAMPGRHRLAMPRCQSRGDVRQVAPRCAWRQSHDLAGDRALTPGGPRSWGWRPQQQLQELPRLVQRGPARRWARPLLLIPQQAPRRMRCGAPLSPKIALRRHHQRGRAIEPAATIAPHRTLAQAPRTRPHRRQRKGGAATTVAVSGSAPQALLQPLPYPRCRRPRSCKCQQSRRVKAPQPSAGTAR